MSTPTLPTDQLLDYITAARWFGGKGRSAELHAVTPLPWVFESDDPELPSVRFEVAELGYPDEPDAVREHYLLGLSYRSAPEPRLEHALIGRAGEGDHDQLGYDAMRDPQACRMILTALMEQRQLVDPGGELRFELSVAERLSADLEPQVYTGQQSNTSVMFGEVAMIKFFRRLELGRNLDIEVHDALNQAGVADVAGLFGWLEATWTSPNHPGPLVADLAMVVEKLADAHDGWDLALRSVAAASAGSADGFRADAHELGAALAATHHALRAAFPTTQLDGAAVAMIMKDRLRRAVGSAAALEPYVDGLVRRFDDLGAERLDTQRVHGDFHLGQTLHTPGGWKIIDFEGEPVKTLAERAAPDSVHRDIAGMLRSFDYAAASAPGPLSQEWAQACRTAFLTGYAGNPLTGQEAAVLRAYEADKAVYEVVYEVRNRPDWVDIPLAAVAVLARSVNGSRTRGPDHDPDLPQTQVEE